MRSNEEVIWEGIPSWKALIFTYKVLFSFGILGWWERKSVTYTITDERVIYERGVFSREQIIADSSNITDISVSQGMLERDLGVGKIAFNTPGSDVKEVEFKHIEEPEKVADLASRHLY